MSSRSPGRAELKSVIIHTDGACSGNPGPGGWAAVFRCGPHCRELSGAEPATTNNRMELQAAIEALTALKEPCAVTLHTDSQYLRQGITEWLPRWKVRQWRTVNRQPVKNEDQWRRLDQEAVRHRVAWKWVKGHAGQPDNERCDVLANLAIAGLRQQYSAKQLKAFRDAFETARRPGRNQPTFL